jgi:acetoacetyl-CoA synthetase
MGQMTFGLSGFGASRVNDMPAGNPGGDVEFTGGLGSVPTKTCRPLMMTVPDRPLWTPGPERRASANLTAFVRAIEDRWDVRLPDYASLHRFSVDQMDQFWISLWDFCGVIAETRGEIVVRDRDKMPGATFFPDARLNFAENVLGRRRDGPAIVFWDEERTTRSLTWTELSDAVARMARALRALGVGPGDRIAGYLPNVPETMIAALASAAVGAIWSSCSPDFGVQGVLDRFGQITPRVLIAADGYRYGGTTHDRMARLPAIAAGLPTVEQVIVVPHVQASPSTSGLPHAVLWPALLAEHPARDLRFESLPFNHPLYILYSSGTTGPPKCLVHGAGGTLVQHLKEHQLHCDIRPGDRVFYFTTCGWMMWNWLLSTLASGATALLYDGSPFRSDGDILFDFADATGMTLFGTSAKFIDALRKTGRAPMRSHRLETIRTITSTGSPLMPEGFDYVYERVKRDVHLASISGGTDIISCFVGGNPLGPVWRGEIQARALGMQVEVFDEHGRSVREQKGELVCTAPFPSMPLGFWNDPADARYRAAYFTRFPGVWHHGDYVELTAHDGMIIYGRSDAVLNAGGVRIGTAEIYRQVERLPEVIESVAIGQDWDGDERIVLFVRLAEGETLTPPLVEKIRRHLRENASPRHVPARVVQVQDIPRTKSGKIVELAVRDVVHGRPVRNMEALANPAALDQFAGRPELNH